MDNRSRNQWQDRRDRREDRRDSREDFGGEIEEVKAILTRMKRQLQDSRDYSDRLRTQRSTLEKDLRTSQCEVARKSNEVSSLEKKVGHLESKLQQCEQVSEQNAAKRLRCMIDSLQLDEVVSATPPEKPEAKDVGGSDTEPGDDESKDGQPVSHALPLLDGPGEAAGLPEEQAVTTGEGAPVA